MKGIEKIIFSCTKNAKVLSPFSTTRISSREAKRKQEFTNNVIEIQ